MELQLQKQQMECLRTIVRETQQQEQTQELRISDGMPDIGSIIGAWGQIILRGKEWESDSIRVSGGTMVWVQYLSEDGEETACVESWLPFQMQWKLPPNQSDGTIFCQSFLKSVDARSTSARKMIIRTNISLLAEGMEACQYDTFVPDKMPDDIQILTQRYPVLLTVEAGEKAFTLDEMVLQPQENPGVSKLISYQLQPEITEEKIMGDKLVFRGKAILHVHYSSEDGTQHSWDQEIPFSQYAELRQERDQSDTVKIWPCITSLEVEVQQEQLHLKTGIVCQYQICGNSVIELVTDAYSNARSVECVSQMLELPVILESKTRTVTPKANCDGEGMRMADVRFLPQPVSVQNLEDRVELTVSGKFQPLYYDLEGKLCSTEQMWTETVTIPAAENVRIEATVWPKGKTQGNLLTGSGQMESQLELHLQTRQDSGIPILTALKPGEMEEPDPYRPSLILKRAGAQSLWELAKENRSTVSLIRSTNDLQGEPAPEQMLLIPIA